MAKGYTLEEMQAMGAKPTSQIAPTQKRGYTREELEAIGAKPSYLTPPKQVAPAEIPVEEPQQKGGILSAIGNVGIGAAKGLGETAAGFSTLGEKMFRGLGAKGVSPTYASEEYAPALEAKGTAQKFGKGVERVAEFIAPVGRVAKGVQAVEKAVGLAQAAQVAPGIGKALGRLGVRGVAEGISTAGVSAAQTGGDIEETKKAGLIGAASVPVFGAIGKVAGAVGRAGMEALGKSTGAGEAALREAFTNPNVIKYARQGADAITSLQEQALEGAQRGLNTMAKLRGAEYVRALEKIKADPQILREVTDNAVNIAKDALENASVRVGRSKILTLSAFKDSAIEQGKTSVAKAYRTLATWKDHTPAGLDRLKKKLTQFQNAVKNTTDGSYAAIRDMRNAVDEGLKTFVPGYSTMTAKYREASDLIDEIERALSLKDSVMKDTAVRKLMSTMRQNNEIRLDFLKSLGQKAGEDVTGKIAGATLAPATPRGLVGSLSGLGAASIGNIPGLLLWFSVTSPRLVGEVISILGKTGGKTMTAEMKRALNALIIQATKDSQSE